LLAWVAIGVAVLAALPTLFEAFRRLRYSKNGLESRIRLLMSKEGARTQLADLAAPDLKARRVDVWNLLKQETGAYPATYLVNSDIRKPFNAFMEQYAETADSQRTGTKKS